MFFFNEDDFYNFDVFVVGNGFDKAYGNPTSYEDFYNAIKLVYENISSFDQFSVYFTNGVNKKSTLDFYNVVRSNLTINYYLQYVLKFNKVFNRWCDFENELGKILHSFDYFLSKINADSNTKNYEVSIRGKLETINIFSVEFSLGWRGFTFISHDDYQTGVLIDGNYEGKYDYFSLVNRIDEIRKEVIEGLYEDLCLFKTIFKLYLKAVILPKDKFLDKISLENIVTFNYSKTIENSTLATGVFHIHGDLDGDIVLGVDSTKPFINNAFNKFSKASQRGHLSDSQNLMSTIKDAKIIGYFGLSFDSSDKSSFDFIFKNTDAKHYVFYYKNTLDDTISNIQEIIGMDYYSLLKNNGKIEFVNSSLITFIDKK